MAGAAIRIYGKTYPIPTTPPRMGELRTIKRLSGLNPPEFMAALGEITKTQDPDVFAALIWWIVYREDPTFTPEMVDDIEIGAIEGEDDTAEAPVVIDPLPGAATSGSSPISASASSPTPAEGGERIPANGGDPALAR